MKKILISITTCAMIITTGCSNEEIVSEMSDSQNFTLNVSMGANSRTFNGEDGKCLWGSNEQIYVTSEDGKVFGTLSMVSISDDKKSAVFSGPINGHPDQLKYTIYPKPDNNGEIKVSVNGENHNAPMYGEISGKNSQFQYAGGLVKLSMKGANGAKVNVPNTQTTPNAIGGTYKFNLQKGEMEYHPGSTPVGIESIPADGVVYLPVATTAIVNGQKQNIDKVDLNIFIGSNLTPVSISDVPVMNGKISTDKVPNIEVDENGVVESGVVVTTAEQLKAALSEQNNAIKNIKLAENIELVSALVLNENKTITLDLNGKKLELTGTISGGGAVFEVSNGVLNIIGNGQVIASTEANATGNNAVWVRQNGKVNIYGGTFSNYGKCIQESDVDKQNDQEDLIYVGSDAQEGAKINVYGGDFSSEVVCGHFGLRWLLNQNNDINSQRIFVWGGTFHNFNPANAETHDQWMSSTTEGGKKFGSYLAEGYIVENASEGVFVVKPNQKNKE